MKVKQIQERIKEINNKIKLHRIKAFALAGELRNAKRQLLKIQKVL